MKQPVLKKSMLHYWVIELLLIASLANHVVTGQMLQNDLSSFNQNYNRAYNSAFQGMSGLVKPLTAFQRPNVGSSIRIEAQINQLRPQNPAQQSNLAAYSSSLNNPIRQSLISSNLVQPVIQNNFTNLQPNLFNNPTANPFPFNNFARQPPQINNLARQTTNGMFNANLNRQSVQTNPQNQKLLFQNGNNLLNPFTGPFNNAMNSFQRGFANAVNGFNNPFKITPIQPGFKFNQLNTAGRVVTRPRVPGINTIPSPSAALPFNTPNLGSIYSGIPTGRVTGMNNPVLPNRGIALGMSPRGMIIRGPFGGIARGVGTQVTSQGIFGNRNMEVHPRGGMIETPFIRPVSGVATGATNVGLLQGVGNIGTASLGISTGMVPDGSNFHNNTEVTTTLSPSVANFKNSSLEVLSSSSPGVNATTSLDSSIKISTNSTIDASSSLASLLKNLTDKSALLTDDGSSLRNYLVKINSTESDLNKWDSIIKEKEKDGKLNATSWAKVDPFCSCNDIVACNCCLTLDLAAINKKVCLEANLGKSGNGTKLSIIVDKQRQGVTQITGKEKTTKFDMDGLGKGDLEITIPEKQNSDQQTFCGTASLSILGLKFPALPLGCFSYTNDTISSIK